MCLILSRKERCIAEKDMIVYKHIIDIGGGGYISSYQHVDVQLNKLYVSELEIDEYEPNKVYIGLHSFRYKKNAIYDRDFWNKNGSHAREVVVKCMIPKGSAYYRGIYGVNESIASDQLIYLEIIH